MSALKHSLLALSICLIGTPIVAADRPNIVFILADDLGWGEVGCFGQQKIPTPNIDRLAKQGMRLTNHYSGAPVCAPSRCVLMTGRHLGHAEIRGNQQAKKTLPQFDEGQHPISAEVATLPLAFRQAGYATGAMGKWGLGPVGSTGDPNKKGFDLFFGYNCQAVAHSYYPKFLWRNAEQVQINAKPISGHQKPVENVRGEDYLGDKYAPYLMIEEATKFIDEHKAQPFFLYLACIEPHVAMHPPQAAVDRFPKEWDSEPHRGESGYLPHPRPRAGYAAMISDLDSYVGRVMEALEKAGVADNTLIVFSSDNGTTHASGAGNRFGVGGVDAQFFNSTNGLKGYKGSVYEGGIRVPTIVRYPGKVKAGTTSAAPSYFADWFPTLAAATGIKPPADYDGENLLPILLGGEAPRERKPLVWVFPEYGGQVAVRMGNFKALRRGLHTKQIGEWEVYDLAEDIGEKNNLAKSHPQVIEQAMAVLKKETAANGVFPVRIPGL